MLDLVKKIYRFAIPLKLRQMVWNYRYCRPIVNKVMAMRGADIEPVKEFLKKHGFSIFPYDFIFKYRQMPIEVFTDADGYKYTIFEGKKMFAKKSWNEDTCREYFRGISLEQDVESPHCYIQNDKRLPDKDMVLADIGVADGNFALAMVDKVKKIYLFECDEEWIEALLKTFAPYKNKVEIVKAYVSDKDNSTGGADMVALDTFFADKQIDYIKADIEGAEVSMLQGGKDILKNKVKKIVCCTYHRGGDYDTISEILQGNGFQCEHNDGYMLFPHSGFLCDNKPPVLRRGIVFGNKEFL